MNEWIKWNLSPERWCVWRERSTTEFALAMPDEYKTKDAVESYRNYYMSEEKQKIASWKKGREKPSWYRINENAKPIL